MVSFFYMVSFCIAFFLVFFILYFVCFGKILSQLEAASSVLPRIETFARCPRVVPSAAPRALRSGDALRFLCSVEHRTQLLILTSIYVSIYLSPSLSLPSLIEHLKVCLNISNDQTSICILNVRNVRQKQCNSTWRIITKSSDLIYWKETETWSM